jgi:hypothetical protein
VDPAISIVPHTGRENGQDAVQDQNKTQNSRASPYSPRQYPRVIDQSVHEFTHCISVGAAVANAVKSAKRVETMRRDGNSSILVVCRGTSEVKVQRRDQDVSPPGLLYGSASLSYSDDQHNWIKGCFV